MNAEEFLRRYESGERDFSKVVLRGIQLNHLDLSGINLNQAWLESTCLMATNLSNANISGANLRFCYLGSANLSNANLSNSQIEATNFNESNLTNADLTKTLLCDSSLVRTNFMEATIQECNLAGSFCRQAIFTNANWDWNYADVIFHETILPNGDIESYNYHPSEAVESLQKRYDSGERIFTFESGGLDLTGIRLSGSVLRFWLTESELRYADLRNCNFESSRIQTSFFDFADLSGAVFKEAALAYNSFITVNLSDASFEGAYMEDDDHGGCFDGAIFCRTIMPDGSTRNNGC
ncbi:MAG: pentapeptide repeat-containing protein [Nostoc sp.]|uniref:pentapeptide repeat-containing protein n=1 Tax=Nostoc sp. TaxID=1180 RepID=UPI002FF8B017